MKARVLCVGLLTLCFGSPVGAQTVAQWPIVVEIGNWNLRRNVDLAAAGADFVHAATEASLGRVFDTVTTSRDRRGRLFRMAKLYVVDLPIVATVHTLGHEYGHASRLREKRGVDAPFAFDNWPWPVPFVEAHTEGGGGAGPFFGLAELDGLAVSSGGYEAGRVRDRRFGEEFSDRSGVDYFAAARLIYSRLEEPVAAMFYLRESRLQEERLFLFGHNSSGEGIDDMSAYALTLTAVRHRGSIAEANADSAARQIRRGARWALLDLQLAGSFYRLANYLWTGNAVGDAPALKIAGSRLWPRATFALTSAGISRGAEVLWVRSETSISAHAERVEQAVPLDILSYTDRGRPILAARTPSQWGGGLAVSTSLRSARIHLDGNYWNQATTGRGGSLEGGVEHAVPRGRGTHALLRIGYKSAGFLAGAPDAARWFVSAGLTIRRK